MDMMDQIQQQIYCLMQTINQMKNEINLSYPINNKIRIQFRNSQIDPINKLPSGNLIVECGPDDEIHELIEKYFEKAKINGDCKNYLKFIFQAKSIDIYSKSTIGEIGLYNNTNIFILIISKIKINFKISNDYLYIKSGIICLDRILVKDLINDFLDDTGIEEEDIKNYIYNNKILNQSISLQHAGLYDNSDIIVNLNKPIQYINIIFKSKDEKEIYNIKCLKTEKISSIKRKLKEILDEDYFHLRFNSKKIDNSDEKKSLEELGIKDNSIIFFE